jgi:hypothetical protein
MNTEGALRQGDADVSVRPRIAHKIYTAIAPALGAAAWPRWLYLERAFLDGSEGGDLLFSALAIRTMCEEAQRLHSLDLGAGEIEALMVSENPADHARLDLFLRLARASLDTPKNPLAIDTSSPDLDWAITARPELHAAKQALNDYVHPNYGSHIAALFPERAAAPRILLEGIIAAYDSFFALSWSERPLGGLCVPFATSSAKSWNGVVRRFTKKMLPELRRQTASEHQAGQISSEMQKVFDLTATAAWLTTDHADATRFINAHDIAALVKSLRLPGEIGVNERGGHKSTRYLLWDGASDFDVLTLAMARRAEQMLIEAFPNGGPDRSQQQRWLHFVSLALQLALALDDVKVAALKAQLIRQIVCGNPLGILLCVRSLIEHKAVVNWLVNRLGTEWTGIGKRVRPGSDLPAQAISMEESLAKFLAGTKGSAEDELPWTTREEHGRWTLHLSLPDIVNGAFPSANQIQRMYDIASAALHGRIYRGFDLLEQKEKAPAPIWLGLLLLEWLCDKNERWDLLAQAFVLHTNIEHAAARGGTAAATSEAQVKGAFGHFDGKLRFGRDFTGDGSQESPFEFRSHLQFHLASQKLLKQMEIEWTDRQPIKQSDGRWCDCYQATDREWWFIVPQIPTG